MISKRRSTPYAVVGLFEIRWLVNEYEQSLGSNMLRAYNAGIALL